MPPGLMNKIAQCFGPDLAGQEPESTT